MCWTRRQSKARSFRRQFSKVITIIQDSLPLACWVFICVAVFWQTYHKYKHCPQYYYLHGMLGESLCWSRGSASVLCLSASLVLLPVCRNVITWARPSLRVLGNTVQRSVDRNIWFHRICAVTLLVASAIHSTAHLVNAKRFSSNFSDEFPQLNFATCRNQDLIPLVVFSIAGSTGLAMMLVLLIMISASFNAVRQGSFEVFWYTHHMFVVFFALLVVHGLGGVVKHQANLKEHIPGCKWTSFSVKPGNATITTICGKRAEFVQDEPEAWKWIAAPVCLYVLDRAVRVMRSRQSVNIVKVVQHASDVIEVQMQKENFKASPGQYVFVNCGVISKYEWHPFTITKCPGPEDGVFSLHFKKTGDWTSAFAKLLLFQQTTNNKQAVVTRTTNGADVKTKLLNTTLPRLAIDGPYGSPCMDNCQYDVSLCIAAGIGITPFAAVLHDLGRTIRTLSHGRIRRIYFVWVCRETESFQWFADLLVSTYQQLWQRNLPDMFVCNLYVTRSAGGGPRDESWSFLLWQQKCLFMSTQELR